MTRGYVVSAFNRAAIIIRLPPEARAEEHVVSGTLEIGPTNLAGNVLHLQDAAISGGPVVAALLIADATSCRCERRAAQTITWRFLRPRLRQVFGSFVRYGCR
jgi:hypothetical protein